MLARTTRHHQVPTCPRRAHLRRKLNRRVHRQLNSVSGREAFPRSHFSQFALRIYTRFVIQTAIGVRWHSAQLPTASVSRT
jgi:hypothetical protein